MPQSLLAPRTGFSLHILFVYLGLTLSGGISSARDLDLAAPPGSFGLPFGSSLSSSIVFLFLPLMSEHLDDSV